MSLLGKGKLGRTVLLTTTFAVFVVTATVIMGYFEHFYRMQWLLDLFR